MRQHLIKEATEKRLLEQGLKLKLSQDDSAISPRETCQSVFVGGEVRIPHDVDKGQCFDDFVRNYCRQVLECKVTDIVWATVYKYEHGGVEYSLGSSSCPWDSGIAGFIYITKEELRSHHGVKRITQQLYDLQVSWFAGELKDYTAYCNGDIYGIEIFSQNKDFESETWGVVDIDDHIDYTVNAVIDQAERENARILENNIATTA